MTMHLKQLVWNTKILHASVQSTSNYAITVLSPDTWSSIRPRPEAAKHEELIRCFVIALCRDIVKEEVYGIEEGD